MVMYGQVRLPQHRGTQIITQFVVFNYDGKRLCRFLTTLLIRSTHTLPVYNVDVPVCTDSNVSR